MKILAIFFLLIIFAACGRREASEYIRVLIGTPNFAGFVHERVEITSAGAFFVNGTRYEAGEIFRAAGEFYDIAPAKRDGRLEIIGLARSGQNGANPQYRGVLEISRRGGGFVIVNELCLEEYLYAVLPSEMPSSFGVEASKVQAVTARSFAVHQMRQNRFAEFGAHVDDSVLSQVYNNFPENEVSIAAVRATRGRVLKFGGEIILANYFSTSGGTTANFGEVWAAGAEFPTHTPEFLRARAQVFDCPGNLRCEEAAAAFFRNTEINAIDRDFPWFRWNVTMTAAELTERINRVLPTRHAANPALIQGGTSIGEIRALEVTRRGQGGNIMEMVFHGADAAVRVRTEFNIRALLSPGEIPVTRHDGTNSANLSLLPSAFFTMEAICAACDFFYNSTGRNLRAVDCDFLKNPDCRLYAVTFFGGGNGHGVGMSQNGVRALLDMGLTYAEILQHFYPGVEIARR